MAAMEIAYVGADDYHERKCLPVSVCRHEHYNINALRKCRWGSGLANSLTFLLLEN